MSNKETRDYFIVLAVLLAAIFVVPPLFSLLSGVVYLGYIGAIVFSLIWIFKNNLIKENRNLSFIIAGGYALYRVIATVIVSIFSGYFKYAFSYNIGYFFNRLGWLIGNSVLPNLLQGVTIGILLMVLIQILFKDEKLIKLNKKQK